MSIIIDIDYDFRNDSGGKDPDSYSQTLKAYHQLLWSKDLPTQGSLQLNENLDFLSPQKSFFFASDSIIPTYSYWRSYQHIINQIAQDKLWYFDYKSYTIGGMLIFPRNKIDNQMTINMARGINKSIRDRFDLTLECIRLYYNDSRSPLFDVLNRYSDFFRLFKSFDGYVAFFHLQDLLTDKQQINFFLPFDGFDSDALPKDKEAYNLFMENSLHFIDARASRIKRWCVQMGYETRP